MAIPRGDDYPDRVTLVGCCVVCRETVTTECEHEQFGLGINDVIHKACERRQADRRKLDRRQ